MRLAVGLIVFAALLRGLVWAVALPPWQGPDEPAHFAYIQRIATDGRDPGAASRAARPLLRRHEGLGARDRLPALSHAPAAEAPATRAAGVSGRARRPAPEEPRRADHVEVPAGLLPASPPPRTCCRSCTPTPSGCTRCASVSAILGAITVWLVLAAPARGRCGARDRACWAVSAYAVLPMVSQASAICNPDVLLMAALAGLARSLLVLCRGWTRRSALVVALWALLATLTKPIGGPAAAHGHRRHAGLRHGGANRAPPRRSGRRDRRGARWSPTSSRRRLPRGLRSAPPGRSPRFATASRTCGSSTCLPFPSWTRRIPPTARSTRSRRGESGSRRAPASSAG